MCRIIQHIICRIDGQTQPEFAVVLTVAASSCAFLLSDLGSRTPSIVSAVAALFS
jgi:hypothetical protein